MSERLSTPADDSPCVLVCMIDTETGFCFGCGRTREEIFDWRDLTRERRQEILAVLPARRETIERKPRRETRRARLRRESEGTP
ncbi:MAG: DUF1289 domain-containing protein [Rhizobiaceae bacterium]